MRKYHDFDLYARLVREARSYWAHITAVLLISLLASPIALLVPLPLKITIDSVIGPHPLPAFLQLFLPETTGQSGLATLLLVAGLVVAIALLDQLQKLGSWVVTTYTGEKLALVFRARLFSHVQRLSFSYHDSRGTADSIYRIQDDAHSIQGIAVGGLIPLMSAGFTFIGMVYVTARIDWQLALVALTVGPAIYLITSGSLRHLRSGWQVTKSLESATLSVVQEVLTSLRVVKVFGRERHEQDRFVSSADMGIRAKTRAIFLEGLIGLLVGLATAIGTALVLTIGVRHVQSGILSLGDLILVAGYLAQLYTPIQTMSSSIARWQSSLASAERAFTLLDEAPDVAERPDARSLVRANGGIAFCDVSFGYNKRGPVLHHVSFEVGPGARLGISGPTGAGKTTLVSLLMRFYDPTDGRILLDGIDLRDYKLADLRNQFAVVLQEPVLFSASIAENIAYARPDATESEIIEAAKAANAHDFVVALPDGYQTFVGERGMQLSGGERQRIALARAFLKDAPILILDEPTSSVDLATESVIMEALERLMRGRTTFMIAHRLTTLTNCDVRLEIDNGRVASVAPIQCSGHV
jgi:ATP-binding cassette, subfamily B, bacterial